MITWGPSTAKCHSIGPCSKRLQQVRVNAWTKRLGLQRNVTAVNVQVHLCSRSGPSLCGEAFDEHVSMPTLTQKLACRGTSSGRDVAVPMSQLKLRSERPIYSP